MSERIGRGAQSVSRTRFSLRDFSGGPVVLAFAAGWAINRENERDRRAIRAELRGLGAVLVVVSEDGVWSFRPDDDLERVVASAVDLDDALVRKLRRHDFAPDRDGAFPTSIFVFDDRGDVRFARCPIAQGTAGVSIHAAMAEALGAAGRAVTASRPARVSRRDLVVASLVAGFALAFEAGCNRPKKPEVAVDDAGGAAAPTPDEIDVTLNVNGETAKVRVDGRSSLLDALRERMGLTGTKKGCDHGQCGACTVHVDGRRVLSCLTLAVMAEGRKITTIEGLATGDVLHPVQEAFIVCDGLQCGYCTPGQIMSAVALLREGHAKTDDDVREEMSGNLCRCGAYPNIVAAVKLARTKAV